MAMPSLIATRWVGQNWLSIFRRLWTKVQQIKFACAGVSVVCKLQCRFPIDDVFLLSGDIPDEVTKLYEIAPKFWCFRATKYR